MFGEPMAHGTTLPAATTITHAGRSIILSAPTDEVYCPL